MWQPQITAYAINCFMFLSRGCLIHMESVTNSIFPAQRLPNSFSAENTEQKGKYLARWSSTSQSHRVRCYRHVFTSPKARAQINWGTTGQKTGPPEGLKGGRGIFRKTKKDEEPWLLGDRHKSGNVERTANGRLFSITEPYEVSNMWCVFLKGVITDFSGDSFSVWTGTYTKDTI